METAVEGDPQNGALRLHLASLLLADEQPQKALDHCAAILQKDPANKEALALAAKAAEAAGDKIRADGYRRLHEALGWSTAQNLIENTAGPEPPNMPPVRPPDERQKLRATHGGEKAGYLGVALVLLFGAMGVFMNNPTGS